MSPDYPLVLDLTGRRVLVVGGGPVAARRATGCLDAGAVVDVVAPAVCDELAALVAEGRVRLALRAYAPGDVDGAWLVHTCTGDAAVDATVAAGAEEQRVFCVRAGDAAASDAWVPAVARVGATTVAVSAGGDPRRAAAVRDAVALDLETGGLPLRRRRAAGPGRVTLVGGGPGDPGLVTTRGRQRLAEADVVVVDRLAPRALLDTLAPDVEVVEAGKAPGAHALTQDDINRVLVDRAREGHRVVRLKGGDPYVLGRGGEEAAACREAGVDVEVVPGVTSAFAVPAAAGIPVTHRGLARHVTVATGHDALEPVAAEGALGSPEGTLVLLMAVSRLAETAHALVTHGWDPATPVAVVESGFSPDQRTTTAPLVEIATRATERGVRNPAVVVVGAVAAFAHEDAGPDPGTESDAVGSALAAALAAEHPAHASARGRPSAPVGVPS